MILDAFPDIAEFYKTYWGKRPFIVRGHVPQNIINTLIDGDTLAGLALEDGIKSRFITNSENGTDWQCTHGPFDEDHFAAIGEKNWSLLVQNVEQYHKNTAKLLAYFQFSPRWLMDDIMVSYSSPGGSVGPHTDSYHTFLVQGIGTRTWKISDHKIDDDRYVNNPDVKVLQHGFEGKTYEVTAGDIIYMPPFFGHEGKTLDAAMTFSVGFLGPKLSEILSDYAFYLEENETLNARFLAQNLTQESAGFTIGQATQNSLKNTIKDALDNDDFARWLAVYFSTPSHTELEETDINFDPPLKENSVLYRPEHIKLAITPAHNGDFYLAVLGDVISISKAQTPVIEKLNEGKDIIFESHSSEQEREALIKGLYERGALLLR